MKSFIRYRLVILAVIIMTILQLFITVFVGAFMILTPQSKFIKAKKMMENVNPYKAYQGVIH